LVNCCDIVGIPPLKVVLDTPTRWNSTREMLSRFLELERGLRYLSADREEPFGFTVEEISQIELIVVSLKAVNTATSKISGEDCRLLAADLMLEVLMNSVERGGTLFSKTLHRNLGLRIAQRRGPAARLARYLYEGKQRSTFDDLLEPSLAELSRLKKPLPSGLEKDIGELLFDFMVGCQDRSSEQPTESRSLRTMGVEEFDVYQVPNPVAPVTSAGSISRETVAAMMEIFESTRIWKHGHQANAVFQQLQVILDTILPTSVPSERLFSKARHSRRYCQGGLNDERYTRRMFLKDFYNKSRPWDDFMAEHEIEQPDGWMARCHWHPSS